MDSFYKKIKNLEFSGVVVSYAFLFLIFTYSYQAILPAFNADDVIQIQEVSNDSYTFLGSGRWGYFFIFNWVQQASPSGIFATFLGSIALFFSAIYASRIIGIKSGIATLLFVLASTVSIYFGFLFAFDSTRLAYPIAVFLAIYGFYCFYNKNHIIAIGLIALSLAFYQSALQVVATVFLISVLYGALLNTTRGTWKNLLLGCIVLLASMAVYLFFTKLLYYFLNFQLSDRMGINVFAFIENYKILAKNLFYYIVPFSNKASWYMGYRVNVPVVIIFLTFISILLLNIRASQRKLLVLFSFVLSLFSPYALAFVSTEVSFPPRSLIAIASLHAAWLALSLELLLRNRISSCALVIIGAVLIATHSMQINKKAFDDYLVSQEDLFATNRIISRIEQVAYPQMVADPLKKLPIAVIYSQPLPAGARGDVGTARAAPWSKDWIFRLIDNRFVVASAEAQDQAKIAAKNHASWPAPDAVFLLDDGTVVVVIN